MDARSTHRLRARIARLAHTHPDWRPEQIAREAGCARSTVYKFLKSPGRDRRTFGLAHRGARVDPAVIAAVRRLVRADPFLSAADVHAALVARADLDPTFGPVPAARTLRRLVATLRGQETQPATRPPADPREPADAPDGTGDPPEPPMDTAAAVDALRVLLREVLAEREDYPVGSPARFRLRQQIVAVATALARADHLRPAASSAAAEVLEMLDAACEEVLVEAESAAVRARPRSDGQAAHPADSAV